MQVTAAMVRAVGVDPHRPCGPTDFLTASAFAACCSSRSDYPFTIRRQRRRLECCPLVTCTFPPDVGKGARIAVDLPDFEQFYVAGFGALIRQSGASAIPPRPHRVILAASSR